MRFCGEHRQEKTTDGFPYTNILKLHSKPGKRVFISHIQIMVSRRPSIFFSWLLANARTHDNPPPLECFNLCNDSVPSVVFSSSMAVEAFVQFCTECAYLLKKFYNFKEKCLLATKVLRNWRKQKPKVQRALNQLQDQIPPFLSLSNRNNQKIYFYEHLELEYPESDSGCQETIDNIYSNQTHTQNLHSNQTEIQNFYSNDVIDYYGEINEFKQVKIDDNQSDCEIIEFYNDLDVKSVIDNYSNNSQDKDFEESSGYDLKNLLNDTAVKSDSNSETRTVKKRQKTLKLLIDTAVKSDNDSDNLPAKKKRRTLAGSKLDLKCDKEKKAKRVQSKQQFNKESLKNMLKKFNCSEVKDKEGNVIDIDCIVNSLDKMHASTLTQIKNRIAGTTALSADAIQVLSRVQKKYGNQYSSVFTIEHLTSKEEIMAEFAKRQLYEAYVASEHKCELCYRGFKHKKLYEYHVNTHHDANQPHHCAVCQMRFKNLKSLLKHKMGHRAVYKCKLCPLVTNYSEAMVNHYHQHKGVIYACEICKATFKSKSSLSGHMIWRHQSQHICSLCARTFASTFGLLQHKTRKHENESIVEGPENKICELCNITFANDDVYQTHLKISHAIKKNKTNVYVYKKRNYTAPRAKRNYVCRVCKITEHNVVRLMWHFKREHPTEEYDVAYNDKHKHLCHVCGKRYASITDLNEHKHVHTGEKPYACDKCPKTFHRKINLRNHMERHMPPARECQQCGKKFVSCTNLNTHMRTHIGVRHYICEICSKSFLHSSSLNAHVRGVHNHIRRARKHPPKDN